MEEILLFWGGDERGNHLSGPAHDFPFCIPVGSQAPHAAGVAYAFKFRKEPRVAVCLFGDGATSKGDVCEAMNFAGVQQAAGGVRRQQQSVGHLRAAQLADGVRDAGAKGHRRGLHRRAGGRQRCRSRCALPQPRRSRPRATASGPRLIEALTYRLGDHTTADDAARYRAAEEVQARWKEEPIARLRAYLVSQKAWGKAEEEQLVAECQQRDRGGGRALSGHRAARARDHVRSSLRRAAEVYAAQRDERRGQSPMPEVTLVEAVNLALARAMADDAERRRVRRGCRRQWRRISRHRRPAAALRARACDRHAAGRTADQRAVRRHGGAGPQAGRRDPVHGFPLSLHRSAGEPRLAAAQPHAGAAQLPDGAAHAVRRAASALPSITPRAPRRCSPIFPGLRVVIPSSPERAYGLLLAAIRDPDPVVFLEPTRIYRAAKGEVEDNGEALPLDAAFVLREGRDVTLISWGAMVKETLAAADELAAEGISAEVIDLATLKPYDEETVLASVRARPAAA